MLLVNNVGIVKEIHVCVISLYWNKFNRENIYQIYYFLHKRIYPRAVVLRKDFRLLNVKWRFRNRRKKNSQITSK